MYWQEFITALLAYHRLHLLMMQALVSEIFYLHFSKIDGHGDLMSIFIGAHQKLSKRGYRQLDSNLRGCQVLKAFFLNQT